MESFQQQLIKVSASRSLPTTALLFVSFWVCWSIDRAFSYKYSYSCRSAPHANNDYKQISAFDARRATWATSRVGGLEGWRGTRGQPLWSK